jgi:Ser/Thr protein kinase RdoA (MazF antagonist)
VSSLLVADVNLSLSDLLSRRAVVIQTTRRAAFEKRIVELNGTKYVLYRFPSRKTARRFERILSDEASSAGLQRIAVCGQSPWPGWFRRCWVALHYEDGEQIHSKTSDEAIFSSLGQVLGRLHRQSNPEQSYLLLPPWHENSETLLALRQTCSPEQAQWLAESQQRLNQITEFRLTHGDLHPKNIIVTPSAHAMLIDYEFLAYDLAGIELGGLLLRPFCRTEKKRQAILKAYLANCDEITRSQWEIYWRDFLVTAALRISAQRDRRHQIYRRRHQHLSRLGKLPLPAVIQSHIVNLQATQAETIRRAADGSRQHLEIAGKLVSLIDDGSINEPNALISECFKKPPNRPV